MKHLALILLAALALLGATAQTTFNVDMTCAPEGFENVFVTGPWCGWCANDTYNTMTDPDGDGVYTVEVADLTGVVEYKYAINGFDDQENLVNDMVEGATCAPVTDFSGYANRQMDAGSVANDDYGTCNSTCNDCPGCEWGDVPGCVDETACNYDESATYDDGSCTSECPGCTVSIACNYDDSATVDDGSCIFYCLGCTNPDACNFDFGALQDDGTCLFPEDLGQCNCDGGEIDAIGVCGGNCLEDADQDGICDVEDDCVGEFDDCGVCNGPGAIYDCGCEPWGDEVCDCEGTLYDQCGVCGGDGSSCVGCTYAVACNYDPEATILDASLCEFGNCPGCTVIGACNYNPTVSEDDGSCEWCSCLESGDVGGSWQGEGAYTLTVEGFPAVQEGLTTYRFYVNMENATDRLSAVYGNDSAEWYINVPDGAFNSPFNSTWNASGLNPTFLDAFPEMADDTYLTVGLTVGASNSGIEGATDPSIVEDLAQPITPFFLNDGATSLECNTLTGSAMYVLNTAANGLPDENMQVLIMQLTTAGNVSGNLNYQVFPQGVWTNEIRVTSTFNVSPSEDVEGCTDAEAANYCPQAQVDDGSCLEIYAGCLDAEACNYAANATTDTGAECTYPNEGSCDCDGNQLDALGVCGGDCELDADNDGVCDDVDPCVGELDACGVCNGPGGIYDCGCTAIPDGNCDCEGNVLDALGVCGGECESDANGNGICDADEVGGPEACGWGTVWNADSAACVLAVPPFLGEFGDYNTLNPCYYDLDLSGSVGAGDLINFLSTYNLATGCSWTDEYSCGDPVSYQCYDYATVLIGDQCWFAENLRNENYDNGDAISAGLSDSEWLSTTSGATAVYGEHASNLETYGRLYNWYAVDDARGLCPSGWHVPTDGEWTVMTDFLGGASVAGGQMKTTYGWSGGGNGTNSSGFSGLPGGSRNFSGLFYFAGNNGYWWSSSPDGSDAWYRGLDYDFESVDRSDGYQRYGFSVRCVRDAE